MDSGKESKPLLTVFTPTYNRAYCLGQLYESLLRQTSNDFCWLIVDDGSTDNTRDLVSGWIDEGKLAISYYRQENGGKMRAHNWGVQLTTTELFLCCDSDDYLTDDAIEKIVTKWENYHFSKDKISGIIGPKCVYKENVKIKNTIPSIEEAMTVFDFTCRRGKVNETFLVFVTEIIRQYPFPLQDDEKFIPEGYIYRQMDDHYKMIPLKEELMICHYLPDGYTSGYGLKKIFQNPKGLALSANDYALRMGFNKKGLTAARNFVTYSFAAQRSLIQIVKLSKTKWMTLLTIPFAVIKFLKMKHYQEKNLN